jgi:hypothetical protein
MKLFLGVSQTETGISTERGSKEKERDKAMATIQNQSLNTNTQQEAAVLASEGTKKSTSQNVLTNLVLDIVLLLVFLVTFEAQATGLMVHEILGLALGGAVVVHLLLHWNWIVRVLQRFLQKLATETRLNCILNIALFVAFTAVVFSGLMISHVLLPLVGLQAVEGPFWNWLHRVSADVSLFLLALHVAMHWTWVVNVFKRYVFAFAGKQKDIPQQTTVSAAQSE